MYVWFQGKTPTEQGRDVVGSTDRRLGRREVLRERYLLPLYCRTFIAVVFVGKGRLVVNSREGTDLSDSSSSCCQELYTNMVWKGLGLLSLPKEAHALNIRVMLIG